MNKRRARRKEVLDNEKEQKNLRKRRKKREIKEAIRIGWNNDKKQSGSEGTMKRTSESMGRIGRENEMEN